MGRQPPQKQIFFGASTLPVHRSDSGQRILDPVNGSEELAGLTNLTNAAKSGRQEFATKIKQRFFLVREKFSLRSNRSSASLETNPSSGDLEALITSPNQQTEVKKHGSNNGKRFNKENVDIDGVDKQVDAPQSQVKSPFFSRTRSQTVSLDVVAQNLAAIGF